MQQEHENQPTSSPTQVAQEYIQGIRRVFETWDTLDLQERREAATYYGYTLAVVVGVPAAAVVSFLART